MFKGFEKTLLIIKPDAVHRHLAGRIITRVEEKGLAIIAMKMIRLNKKLAAKHYEEHKGKAFYPGLIDFITSGPVIVLVAEGLEAIAVCRKVAGATCGRNAEPGSIRGDFGMSNRFNLIHASDSKKSASREIKLYFERKELVEPDLKDLDLYYDFSGDNPL
ncbi:MAG: nucleoside-diphosphate kinase [Planctomycetota bacterium]|jgi:nucleoside-diphosphate kinase